MLDIAFIRENKEKVNDAVKKKAIKLDVEKLLKLDEQRRMLIQSVEEYRSKRNEASKLIGSEKDETKRKKAIEAMQNLKEHGGRGEDELLKLEEEFHALMLLVPQIPADDTPVGRGDEMNAIVEEVGKPTTFSFTPKDHIELGVSLDIVDIEQGVKTSGFRGYYLKNEGALLHLGLMMLGVEELRAHGFDFIIPPTILREFALQGSGQFPFGREETYQVANAAAFGGKKEKEDMFLGGTSEPALLAYFADKKLTAADLPIRVGAMTPCYRSEAGSYGKDTKGLYRLHEFWKVEQVVICEANIEESEKQFLLLLEVAKSILKKLELPYQVVNVCTEDMGAGKHRMYDINTWMPSRKGYGETHSNSMLLDWQARRMNISYKDAEGKKHFAHTLNNTAIASPRMLIALLENHQQKDGSVKIPKALQKFVGAKIIKPKVA
ncbi:MAG: serine--tRNA ligase [Patescibacteria group bacterium]|jgi:seryl-tRNA synthetase